MGEHLTREDVESFLAHEHSSPQRVMDHIASCNPCAAQIENALPRYSFLIKVFLLAQKRRSERPETGCLTLTRFLTSADGGDIAHARNCPFCHPLWVVFNDPMLHLADDPSSGESQRVPADATTNSGSIRSRNPQTDTPFDVYGALAMECAGDIARSDGGTTVPPVEDLTEEEMLDDPAARSDEQVSGGDDVDVGST